MMQQDGPHGAEAEGGDLGGADEARVRGGREDLFGRAWMRMCLW
jgi:hypothetical protein